MQITLNHNSSSTVTLTTEHDDRDAWTAVKLTVDPPEAEAEIKADLEKEALYGHYGHYVDLFGKTTNLDLQAAVHKMGKFTLIAIEPRIEADPNFPPEGAVS
jgi:hypothetical protein